jgi:DNA-binding beta-propeller fold protein YncE
VLEGHEKAAQIARYSPDGKYLVVTSHDAPLGTIFDAELETQKLLQLGRGPMDMAFHPDGRTVLTANHDAGSLAVVDLERAEVLRTMPAGVGVEVLSFY